MSEQQMVELAQAALAHQGIDDTIIAVGQFAPRGQSGSTFAGGLAGGDLGDAVGGIAGGIGLGAGVIGARAANAAATGLPKLMQVAVSETAVYGMRSHGRSKEPDDIVFAVPRAGLTVNVHQRVNVRVLELIDESGAQIELEGNRLPLTHSKDVIELLSDG